MFCKKCGAQINNNMRFCNRCGAPINTQPMQAGFPAQPIANGYRVAGMAGIPNGNTINHAEQEKNKMITAIIVGAYLVFWLVIILVVALLLKKDDKDPGKSKWEASVVESEETSWDEKEEEEPENNSEEDVYSQEDSANIEAEENSEDTPEPEETEGNQEVQEPEETEGNQEVQEPEGSRNNITGDASGQAAEGQASNASGGAAQAYIMDDVKIQMVRAATNVGFQNPDCWDDCQYDDFGNMISASGEKGKAWWRYDAQGNVVSYEFIDKDGNTTTREFEHDAQGRFTAASTEGLWGSPSRMVYLYDEQGYLVESEEYILIDGRVMGEAERRFNYNAKGVITTWEIIEIDGGRGYFYDPRGEW